MAVMERPIDGSPLVEFALYYASKGIPVFPCWPNAKEPINKHGVSEASLDENHIRGWWRAYPLANIGGATGFKFDVLDVDIEGDETLLAFDPIRSVAEVATPRNGGSHIYFEPSIVPLKNGVRFAKGLDFRSKGGYVMMPPSRFEGNTWRWKTELNGQTLPQVPSWIVGKIKRDLESDERPTGNAKPAEKILAGSRNSDLFRLGCRWRNDGLGFEEIYSGLLGVNHFRCEPPLEKADIQRIATQASKYDPKTRETLKSLNEKGGGDTFLVRSLSHYDPEAPEYLQGWEPYFRTHQLNLLDAKGGSGKTTWICAMAALGSTGRGIHGKKCEPFNTLYFGNEDTAGEFRSLFDQIGGDTERVFPCGEAFRLDDFNLNRVEQTIKLCEAKLVCFDSLAYYLDGVVKNQLDGPALANVFGAMREVARSTGCAMVNLRHFSKYSTGKVVEELGGGHEQWRNSHRSQLVLRPNNIPRSGIAVHAKGGLLSPKGEHFGFVMDQGEFKWIRASEIDLEELYGEDNAKAKGGRPKAATNEAVELINRLMPVGTTAYAKDMLDAGEALKISTNTMYRTAETLGINLGVRDGKRSLWVRE